MQLYEKIASQGVTLYMMRPRSEMILEHLKRPAIGAVAGAVLGGGAALLHNYLSPDDEPWSVGRAAAYAGSAGSAAGSLSELQRNRKLWAQGINPAYMGKLRVRDASPEDVASMLRKSGHPPFERLADELLSKTALVADLFRNSGPAGAAAMGVVGGYALGTGAAHVRNKFFKNKDDEDVSPRRWGLRGALAGMVVGTPVLTGIQDRMRQNDRDAYRARLLSEASEQAHPRRSVPEPDPDWARLEQGAARLKQKVQGLKDDRAELRAALDVLERQVHDDAAFSRFLDDPNSTLHL